MDVAATVINGVVVGLVGLALALAGKGRFDRLEARIDCVDHRMDRLEDKLEAVRSDLTQVALAVGVGPRTRNA